MSGVYLCCSCTFSAWCLIKHRDVVTFSFHYHIKQWTRKNKVLHLSHSWSTTYLTPHHTYFMKRFCPLLNEWGVRWTRLNILIHEVILKIFRKPLLRCQGTIGLSCHRECRSVAPLSECDGVVVYCEVYILFFLLSLVSLHYFVKVCCKHFPYSVEVSS